MNALPRAVALAAVLPVACQPGLPDVLSLERVELRCVSPANPEVEQIHVSLSAPGAADGQDALQVPCALQKTWYKTFSLAFKFDGSFTPVVLGATEDTSGLDLGTFAVPDDAAWVQVGGRDDPDHLHALVFKPAPERPDTLHVSQKALRDLEATGEVFTVRLAEGLAADDGRSLPALIELNGSVVLGESEAPEDTTDGSDIPDPSSFWAAQD